MSEPSPERQIAFLTNIQRLLGEGSFVATYKFALLLSLADISVESQVDADEPLTIPTGLIADHFIRHYWRQAAPFTPASSAAGLAILRQNTGRTAGVLTVVAEVRRRFNGSLVEARKDVANWRQLVRTVDEIVREMPLWKLQTVGAERLEFLYENVGRGRAITLKPGVAYCFRRHYALIADLVKGAWARYVRRQNGELIGERADLTEFLFGAERANLADVAPVLMDLQQGECFYCRGAVKQPDEAHVDHFIPWSKYPVDLGHNFVLAHATCNARKSDFLAACEHLEFWVMRSRSLDAEIVNALRPVGVVSELQTSLRIAHWAYTQADCCRGLTWIRGREYRHLAPGWDDAIRQALN